MPQTLWCVLLPFIKFISVIIYLVPCQWALRRKACEQINEYYFSVCVLVWLSLAISLLFGLNVCRWFISHFHSFTFSFSILHFIRSSLLVRNGLDFPLVASTHIWYGHHESNLVSNLFINIRDGNKLKGVRVMARKQCHRAMQNAFANPTSTFSETLVSTMCHEGWK